MVYLEDRLISQYTILLQKPLLNGYSEVKQTKPPYLIVNSEAINLIKPLNGNDLALYLAKLG